ncbi:E3 ubiquitin-protein ligase ZNF598-like [Oscarella lobularis]|uniref:E3 ubiquitin-protein ligase ZNF598-like n=1 Tax=Oscarella lobularis TaxID=121494 RepID=UPI003313DEB1
MAFSANKKTHKHRPNLFRGVKRMPSNPKDPESPKSPVKEMTCGLCCDESPFFAVGPCNHPFCHRCFVRLRILVDDDNCPVCRQELPKPVLTRKIRDYDSFVVAPFQRDPRLGDAYPQSDDIRNACHHLLDHPCPKCDHQAPTFAQLKRHVRTEHDRRYCLLCEKHLTLFTSERVSYTRDELARHNRRGGGGDGPDASSHTGHPLCRFCDRRYFDDDDLLTHLRRDHFFCYICEKDGGQDYYKDFVELRRHCKEAHYVCEVGTCAREPFASVFRNEMQLKAHVAREHVKGGKEARIMRILPVEVSFNDRRGTGTSAFSLEDEEAEEAGETTLRRREFAKEERSASRGKEKGNQKRGTKVAMKKKIDREVREEARQERKHELKEVKRILKEESGMKIQLKTKERGEEMPFVESSGEMKNGKAKAKPSTAKNVPPLDKKPDAPSFSDTALPNGFHDENETSAKLLTGKKASAAPLLNGFHDEKVKENVSVKTDLSGKDFPALGANVEKAAAAAAFGVGFYSSWRPVPVVNDRDYPSLRPSAPPPGIEKPVRKVLPPPGFRSAPPSSTEKSDDKGVVTKDTLFRVLQNDEDKMKTLKLWSGSFLQGELSADDYYVKCCHLIGMETFHSIFKGLVDTLPDPKKRAELMRVEQDARKPVANGKWVSKKKVGYLSEFPSLPGKVATADASSSAGPWRKN